jgi:hypothetical protein
LRSVLRRIFGNKRDEVIGGWRKLHSEELHNMYSSPNIIKQIKSRRMRWAGHVARVGEESQKETDQLEDQGVDGKIESDRSLGDWLGEVWSGFSWLRIETGGGTFLMQ